MKYIFEFSLTADLAGSSKLVSSTGLVAGLTAYSAGGVTASPRASLVVDSAADSNVGREAWSSVVLAAD